MKFNEIIRRVEENPFSAFFYTPSIYTKSKSFLFTDPVEIIFVKNENELNLAFTFLDKYFKKGLFGYCIIDYETGYLFEPKLKNLFDNKDEHKLVSIFIFDKANVKQIASSKIEFEYPETEKFNLSDFHLNTTEKKFYSDLKKIKKHLKEGDTYQVNYTVKGKFNFNGSYPDFIQHLLFNQSAKYTSFINNDSEMIISISPELFFNLSGKKINSKPMKGTYKRGINPKLDLLIMSGLVTGEKTRAENVMITDLIRNDIGRICRYGSVKVPGLFKAEKYESLWQLISSVKGKLNDEVKLSNVIRNIFPCGSVTGAPKIRTMQIIHELEKEKRGIYTGSIGIIKNKEAVFNVAIRTLKIVKGSGKGEVGLGGGIVWDSDPKEEYEETMLKSRFITGSTGYFKLLETILIDNGKPLFLNEHINRIETAANHFLFYFRKKKILKNLDKEISRLNPNKKYKLRLLLEKWGSVETGIKELVQQSGDVKIILSGKRINSGSTFQYFKTTNRQIYDAEHTGYSSQGFMDVLFLNEKNEVAEGAVSNIFICKNGFWFTPPVSSGVLPGIYRNFLLKSMQTVSEAVLTIEDLLQADEIKMVNSVKREVKVDRFYFKENEFKEF